ncbi:unnamed protein product, partial [Dibothriocephalus latus]
HVKVSVEEEDVTPNDNESEDSSYSKGKNEGGVADSADVLGHQTPPTACQLSEDINLRKSAEFPSVELVSVGESPVAAAEPGPIQTAVRAEKDSPAPPEIDTHSVDGLREEGFGGQPAEGMPTALQTGEIDKTSPPSLAAGESVVKDVLNAADDTSNHPRLSDAADTMADIGCRLTSGETAYADLSDVCASGSLASPVERSSKEGLSEHMEVLDKAEIPLSESGDKSLETAEESQSVTNYGQDLPRQKDSEALKAQTLYPESSLTITSDAVPTDSADLEKKDKIDQRDSVAKGDENAAVALKPE